MRLARQKRARPVTPPVAGFFWVCGLPAALPPIPGPEKTGPRKPFLIPTGLGVTLATKRFSPELARPSPRMLPSRPRPQSETGDRTSPVHSSGLKLRFFVSASSAQILPYTLRPSSKLWLSTRRKNRVCPSPYQGRPAIRQRPPATKATRRKRKPSPRHDDFGCRGRPGVRRRTRVSTQIVTRPRRHRPPTGGSQCGRDS